MPEKWSCHLSRGLPADETKLLGKIRLPVYPSQGDLERTAGSQNQDDVLFADRVI